MRNPLAKAQDRLLQFSYPLQIFDKTAPTHKSSTSIIIQQLNIFKNIKL